MPQTNSSNRSATRGSAGSRRASAACAAGQWVRKVGCERPSRGSTRSSRRRKNRSSQVSFSRSARPRRGGERRRVLGGGQHIGADVARERVRDGEAFDPRQIGGDAAAGDDRRQDGAQIRRGLVDQRGHVGAGAVPFQHGELGRMEIAALAVPPHPRELEDRPGAGDQQLLHGELRAGVQPERFAPAVGVFALGAEGAQVDLLAGGGNGVRRLDLGVAARR